MDDIIDFIADLVLEYIVDPLLDRTLNRKFKTWSKNPWTGWLLGLSFVLLLLMLLWGAKIKSVLLIIIGLIGTGLSGYACLSYAIWRHKKGRYE